MKRNPLLRRVFHAFRIFLTTMLLFVVVGCWLYLLGIFGYVLVFGGIPDPPAAEGINASAWLDKNGDGNYEVGEPFIAGVCIWASANALAYVESDQECKIKQNITDASGYWNTYSDQEIYVFAMPPPGLQYTTPPVVRAEEHHAEFGFAPNDISVNNKIAPMEFYADLLFRQEREKRGISYLLIGIVLALLFYLSWQISEKLSRPSKT
jgi:hypothetical protein